MVLPLVKFKEQYFAKISSLLSIYQAFFSTIFRRTYEARILRLTEFFWNILSFFSRKSSVFFSKKPQFFPQISLFSSNSPGFSQKISNFCKYCLFLLRIINIFVKFLVFGSEFFCFWLQIPPEGWVFLAESPHFFWRSVFLGAQFFWKRREKKSLFTLLKSGA